MTLVDGVITWTPDQLGLQDVEIQVDDGRGGIVTQRFTLNVVPQGQNSAPTIVSVPNLNGRADRLYGYDLQADDADSDPLLWSLEEGPTGMSVDPVLGTLRWIPGPANAGGNDVTVRATDPYFSSATQTFTINVSCVNGHPLITSIPPTEAVTGSAYYYSVRASDPDGDRLTFDVPQALKDVGMAIDANGLVSWIPANVGLQNVTVIAKDPEGASALQLYTVDILDGGTPAGNQSRNRAPVITSVPEFFAEVGVPYSYAVTATDPDGDSLAFSLASQPFPNVSIDSVTGVVSWTPTAAQAGSHPITVVVDDGTATASQTFAIEVRQNQPPTINSSAVVDVVAGALYRYDVAASDPENDALTYSLLQAPAGMQIDRFGRIFWDVPVLGSASEGVEVQVADTRGATANQVFNVDILPDTQAPVVDIQVIVGATSFDDDARADVGADVTFAVTATDNVQVDQVTLTVDGQAVALDQGRATVRLGDIKLVDVLATATDLSGNSGTAATTVRVVDPAEANQPIVGDPTLPPHPGFDPTDNQPPIVTITSPVPNTTVTSLTPIIGTVDDPEDNLWYYRVYFARLDQVSVQGIDLDDPDWKIIGESTDEVIDDELAVFDPSNIANDPYAIIVAGFDVNGRGFIQPTIVAVEGNIQFGNFRLELTDLSVPLEGIPIQVNRVYDTLNADREGDFGYGWSLGVQDARILETAPPGTRFQFASPFLSSTDASKVYLTNPEGQRVGFTFTPSCQGSLFGLICNPAFTPDPGVYDRLVAGGRFGLGGVLGALSQGFNPNTYTLITKDGLQYRYDQFDGLERITDRNGNTVDFRSDGVFHSSGTSIQFVRDLSGRIEEVVDPAGNPITYDYDVVGDLQTVTTQAGLTTSYTYLADPAHFLDEATDPRGERVLKAVYDNGEFEGVFDALGNRVDSRDNDADARRAVIRDGNGNPTTLLYDVRGNVLEETDAAGNTIFREYNDPANPDLETRIVDRVGNVTEREHDSRGNVLVIRELGGPTSPLANPIETRFTYDNQNQVTSIINGRGFATSFTNDGAGNLIEIANADGNKVFFTYDSQGRREALTDFNGNTTVFSNYQGSQPRLVVNADGTKERFEYDTFGYVTLQAFEEADGTVVEQSQSEYDSQGRLVREIDGEGNERRLFYDRQLLDYEVLVNPLSLAADGTLLENPSTPISNRKSRVTDYEYDANGQLVSQSDAIGGEVRFRYDGNGNRVLLQDPVGNITAWVYDSLNRVIEERDAIYNENLIISEALDELEVASGADCSTGTGVAHVMLFCYDGEGKLSQTIDRNGRRREFDYDHAGRVEHERWYDAVTDALVRTMSFSYDAVGNMLTAADSDSNYAFMYDSLNRIESVDNNPDGTRDVPRVVLTYGYDAQGNATLTQDDAGVTVESDYDQLNRLATRKWFDADVPAGVAADVDPVRIDFLYNAAGRLNQVDRYSGLNAVASSEVGNSEYDYSLNGLVDALSHLPQDEVDIDSAIAHYDYDYDFAGLVESETRRHVDSAFDRDITYDYDLMGQLTDVVFANNSTLNERFRFDANGNRVESHLHGAEYRTMSGNRLERDGDFRYEYDDEGNLESKIRIRNDGSDGDVTTYGYDHRNRLIRALEWTKGGILLSETEYTYDVQGRRISTRANGASIRYVYNRENIWADFDEKSDAIVRYLLRDEIDRNLARFRPGDGTVWYLADRLGSIRDLANSSGNLLNHNELTSYGRVLSQTNALFADRFIFTGREYDPQTGLVYFRARQYSADSGRFVSEDPMRFAAGDASLYRYVFNNPLLAADPSGESPFVEEAAMAGRRLLGGFVGGVLGFSAGTFIAHAFALNCALNGGKFNTKVGIAIVLLATGAGSTIGAVFFAAQPLGASNFSPGRIKAYDAAAKIVLAGTGSFITALVTQNLPTICVYSNGSPSNNPAQPKP